MHKFELVLSEFDLIELLDECVNLYRIQAEIKQVDVGIELDAAAQQALL
jgi:signal transduction histidine kinase